MRDEYEAIFKELREDRTLDIAAKLKINDKGGKIVRGFLYHIGSVTHEPSRSDKEFLVKCYKGKELISTEM